MSDIFSKMSLQACFFNVREKQPKNKFLDKLRIDGIARLEALFFKGIQCFVLLDGSTESWLED